MSRITRYARMFAGDVRQSFFDLTIVIGVIAFFQFFILRETPDAWPQMLVGLVAVCIGLALFMRGLQVGIFPLGESLAQRFTSRKSHLWLLVFAFVIGFATTIAEPALIAVAAKVASVSGDALNAVVIRVVSALAVGAGIVLGVLRLLKGHPIHYYLIGGYVVAVALAFAAPPVIVGLAFDLGGITTSTVTVPLIAALGIGLATQIKGRNPVVDGFGLIALASVLPMIFVELYGILVTVFGGELQAAGDSGAQVAATIGVVPPVSLQGMLSGFLATVRDVAPVVIVLLAFFYLVLRVRIENFRTKALGFGMVVIGLYAFVFGLEQGLFPIGESLAVTLASSDYTILIYLFAFTVGFATTMAEPALTTIARKAEELSGGHIRQLLLRIFVSFGTGFGILLGAFRIVQGDPILWYLAAGYILVVVLTIFAPKSIVPIAYDSGGVTTSTMTVPIVAAIGIGLAITIPGRDPLIDGLGMIALSVLFPVISVLAYSIFEQQNIRRHEQRLKALETDTVGRILQRLQAEDTPAVSRTKKEIISITGMAGSGVSTAAKGLSHRLRYRHFSAGAIFDAVADSRGVSPDELVILAEEDPSIDFEIDELIQELGIKETNLVIDSRLAYHWIHRSFKVFLEVSPEIGASREWQKTRAENQGVARKATVERAIELREASQKRRYQDMYGLDISNKKPFDLVLDTSALTPEEVQERIVTEYHAWLGRRR